MAANNKKTTEAAEPVESVTAEAVQFLLAQVAIQSPREANKAKDLSARLTAATAAQE